MRKNEIVYIVIVAILSVSLLLGFLTQTVGLDLGSVAWMGSWVSSPVALAIGFAYALCMGTAFTDFNRTMSKKMLQYSVVALGLGMNLHQALASGSMGMLFTVASVVGTMALGWLFGRKMLGVDWQTSYLISSGTAICGGSAIAAIGPVIKAKAESMSVALAVVFVLNAVALFVFPHIGDALGMGMKEFGMWAAIAIHDTSSVVGAGAAYDQMHPDMLLSEGVSALEVATTVKLTRALWIVVLALVTPVFFRSTLSQSAGSKPWYKCVPTFILWFVVAIVFNTYVLSNTSLAHLEPVKYAGTLAHGISSLAKHLITLSLFFIGASLTRERLQSVGLLPLVQGIMLWITVSVTSLIGILYLV